MDDDTGWRLLIFCEITALGRIPIGLQVDPVALGINKVLGYLGSHVRRLGSDATYSEDSSP
jgi:hypothetical protein